jgi:hypothetical protein
MIPGELYLHVLDMQIIGKRVIHASRQKAPE